jgi:hypothetical protein
MRTIDIVAGINILLPYYDKPDGCFLWCGYDELRMDATNRPLTPEDIDKMIKLEWIQDHEECDYENGFSHEEYRLDGQWVLCV